MLVSALLISPLSFEVYHVIALAFVVLWAFRLSVRIGLRAYGKPEDFRYAAWRKVWKYPILRSFFQVYMLQGTIIAIVGAPLVIVAFFGSTMILTPLLFIGTFLAIIGLMFEIRADYESDQFRKNPDNKGTILTTGLRQWVRHPQYLGESVFWWGITFIVTAVVPTLFWPYLLFSPLLITLMLRFVSGVPMLEERLSKKPGWDEYAKKVPAMFRLEKFVSRR